METKNQLEILQKYIGQEFSVTPSPFMKWLQPIVLKAEQGKLTFQYVIRKEMTNPVGTLHGGVTSAIIDDIIGATMFSFDEEHFYTTVNLVVDYFAHAREGDIVIADTSIVKKGKQMVNAQCEIWNADKTRLIARGYSNLLKTNTKRE
jgi:acyl-coenzyme A thioesterase 13